MRVLLPALLMITALGPTSSQTAGQTQSSASDHPIYVEPQDMKWDRIVPELGAGSPEITILHVDQKTGATKLMIRVPQNFHVPKHWHTANETHTVVSGTFIMAHEGNREELGPGSFNYVPSKLVHEAWSKPDEETLLFITVDGPWDVNWVEGLPKGPSN